MKLKTNLKLRKVGNRYMLVDVSDNDVNVTDVYRFNDTAAFVWNAVEQYDFDSDQLATLLCSEYNVDRNVAINDIRELLSSWRTLGLVVD